MKAEAFIGLAVALAIASWWLAPRDPRPGTVSEGWLHNGPYAYCRANTEGGWSCRTMIEGGREWVFILPPRD